MQRSLSSSAADHQHCYRPSPTTRRHLPVHLTYNNTNDYDASDTDSPQHRTGLQRTLSTSSVSSTSSLAGSAAYRILPVRYSSVDRNLQKVPVATADERGINVRILLDRPPRAPHRRRHHHQREEHHRQHMMKDSLHYGSCPVLDKNHRAPPTLLRPSNITYIETRSIVRGCSNDQLSKTDASTGMLHGPSRLRHLSLDTNTLPRTRVIRESRARPTSSSHTLSQFTALTVPLFLIRRASRTISSPKQVASKTFAIRFVRNTSPPFITNFARRSINRRITRRISSPRRRSIRTSSTRSASVPSKIFFFFSRLNTADTALNLMTHLTTTLIECETRLASQTSLTDDENEIRQQLDNLIELQNHLHALEKSIAELLVQSKQLANDRLSRISDQLAFRWKQMTLEINQRFAHRVQELVRSRSSYSGSDRCCRFSSPTARFEPSSNRKSVH